MSAVLLITIGLATVLMRINPASVAVRTVIHPEPAGLPAAAAPCPFHSH
jgi:hypothetical protein